MKLFLKLFAFVSLTALAVAQPTPTFSVTTNSSGVIVAPSNFKSANNIGSGSVTSFSAGTLIPLFTTSVATNTTTPSLTFNLSNAGAYTIFGNNTNASAAPAFNSISSYLDSFSSTQGAILYRGSSGWVALAPGTSGYVLQTNGSGVNPSWAAIASGASGANPSATIGLTAINGSATTFMRSDAAPALSQSITPTWTGLHTFTGGITFGSSTGSVQATSGTLSVIANTGTGNNVLSNSPTLVTPTLGTPASVTLTNGTGLPLTTGVTGVLPVANGGTGVTSSSGANSVVLRDSNSNATVNNLFEGFSTITASGTTVTLTIASVQNFVINGSGGQIIKLPDATTLSNGTDFIFNNNQSSGTVTIQNNSATTVCTLQSGSYIVVTLLTNSTAAGTWDYHNVAPSNASWSTNTLSWAGTYTNGTWNGNAIGALYGGTGTTGLTGYVYGNGTSAMTASTTIPTSALSGTVSNAQLANSAITIAGTSTSLGGSISLDTIDNGLSTTGLIKRTGANTRAIAVAGTDYAAPTTGTSAQLLANNGSGGFSNVTVGTGLSLSAGTLTASGGGTVTSVSGTGSVNGITLSGTVTTSGSLTLGGTLSGVSLTSQVSGTLPVGNGGTGATTLTGILKGNGTSAFTAATAGTDYVVPSGSITGTAGNVTGTVAIANGGTGATSASAALSNLGASPVAGSGSIATVGTITSGVWNGSAIPVANGGTGGTTAIAGNRGLTTGTSVDGIVSGGAGVNFAFSLSHYINLNTNTTISFSNAQDGQVVTIVIYNPSTYTVTWPTIKWAGGTAPTQTTGGHYDVYTIYYNAQVGAYFGSYVQNF